MSERQNLCAGIEEKEISKEMKKRMEMESIACTRKDLREIETILKESNGILCILQDGKLMGWSYGHIAIVDQFLPDKSLKLEEKPKKTTKKAT